MGGRNLPNLDTIFKDEDEADFVPSAGSNLAAIFGVSEKPQKFNKPAPQKKLNTTSNTSSKSLTPKTEVIIAKVVDGFKLENGQYIPVGKLGVALVGNTVTKDYQLILYKSKQEHLSIVTVACDFLYTVHGNNYASYYDNSKENWSILFDTNESCIEFAREVGLSKYFCRHGRTDHSVIYQDLSPINEGKIAKQWDIVDLGYFISTEIIQPFKSNQISFQTMKVQITTDDNWERTLLGISNGTKRVLFLSSSKQISLGPGFPKDRDIMFEIEIINIETLSESFIPKPVTSSKASILSRVGKVGQSILPRLQTSTTTDSDDTEEDVPHKLTKHRKADFHGSFSQKKHTNEEHSCKLSPNADNVVKHKNDTTDPSSMDKPMVPASVFPPPCSIAYVQSRYVTSNCPIYSTSLQNNMLQTQTVMDPALNIMLSETRMANIEIRMGISKIAENVQKLLDKFHTIELQNATTPSSEKSMEATLKMLLAMNMSHTNVKDYEIQQSKINETNAANNSQEFYEQHIGNSQLQMSKELNSSTKQSNSTADEKELLLQVNHSLNKNVAILEGLLKDSNQLLKKALDNLEDTQRLMRENEKENNALRIEMQNAVQEFNTLKMCISSSKQKDDEKKAKEIKKIMTEIYHSLIENFEEESYSSTYIKSSIADTIRDVTLKVLNSASSHKLKTIEDTEPNTSQSTNKHFQKVATDISYEIKVAKLSIPTELSENVILPSKSFN